MRLYDHVLSKLLASAASATDRIDWDTDTFKLVAVDSGYTYSAAHTNLSQIGAGARVYTTAALTTSVPSAGVGDAANPAVSSPAAGDTIVAYVLYKEGASEAQSWLIGYIDTFGSGQPIDIDTTGEGITVEFSDDGVIALRSPT